LLLDSIEFCHNAVPYSGQAVPNTFGRTREPVGADAPPEKRTLLLRLQPQLDQPADELCLLIQALNS
jgi:hypothetical protein